MNYILLSLDTSKYSPYHLGSQASQFGVARGVDFRDVSTVVNFDLPSSVRINMSAHVDLHVRTHIADLHVRTHIAGLHVRTHIAGLQVRTHIAGLQACIFEHTTISLQFKQPYYKLVPSLKTSHVLIWSKY